MTKIVRASLGLPTLRAGPRFPSTKSQGVRCRVSGVREEKQKH